MSNTAGTRADSLNLFYSGAGSDGGAQTDPAACLGNYRSSTEETVLGNVVTNPISGITIQYIGGANGPGAGTLTATGSDELKWTPPGASQGAAFSIANGESKIIEGADANKYIRVLRTSASALSGTATVTLAEVLNNAIGFPNISSALAGTGGSRYHGIFLKNVSATTIASVKAYIATLGTQATSDSAHLGSSGSGTIGTTGSFADWPVSGFVHVRNAGVTREICYFSSRTDTVLTIPAAGRGLLGTSAGAGAGTDTIDSVPGIRIAKEAPSSSHIQTIADDTTSPTGRTWNAQITAAGGVSIGDMSAGAIYGLWIHQVIVVGELAIPSMLHLINFAFDAA